MAPISTYHGPRHPDFATLESRIQSFLSCNNPIFNPCHEYVKAGFFFVAGDKLICFYCGIVLTNVKKYDNPWTEHLLYGSRCAYLRLNRIIVHECDESEWNPCLVKDVCANYESRKSLKHTFILMHNFQNFVRFVSVRRKYHSLHMSTRCRICWNATARYLYNPCSHLVACLNCSTTQNVCPICRCEIESIMKIFV